LGLQITKDLTRLDYDRWSWEGCGEFSGTFLLSPPDPFGYIEDPVYQVAMTTYLGQPCPLMTPLVGRFFGKKGTHLDQYGANLASAALHDQGHRALHSKLQSILQQMMKLGRISAVKEAANFLINKVGEPYITRYITHISSSPNYKRA